MASSTKPTFASDIAQEAYTNTTPTLSGWASTTLNTARYIQIGKTVIFSFWISGTSNATTAQLTLPVTAQATNTNILYGGALEITQDNGVTAASPGKYLLDTTAPTLLKFFKDMNTTGWTASGTKAVRGTVIYEAA